MAIVSAVALIAGGGSLALAANSSSGTTYYGCVSKDSGALRVVAAGKKCHASERGISWNKTGPRGAAGARGRTGVAGLQGTSTFLGSATFGNSTGNEDPGSKDLYAFDLCADDSTQLVQIFSNVGRPITLVSSNIAPGVPDQQRLQFDVPVGKTLIAQVVDDKSIASVTLGVTKNSTDCTMMTSFADGTTG